jgi:Bardet-Biedl syndrome 5 protein
MSIRDSRFGKALVMETTPLSGGYVLGFRVDPADRLQTVYKEITSLFDIYSKSPMFGVKFDIEEAPVNLATLTIENKEEEIEIVSDGNHMDAISAYYAECTGDGSEIEAGEPVFDTYIGLAVEKVSDGRSVENLWQSIRS